MGEKNNVTVANPEKVQELRARYDKLANEAVAPKTGPAPKGFKARGSGVRRTDQAVKRERVSPRIPDAPGGNIWSVFVACPSVNILLTIYEFPLSGGRDPLGA